MGGCRCTYKNCTIRSDGKTHLFHYPVFDKVRCHEWLMRAGRYDFLNLKVSQLKNRCICQHHFADDWFMNDKKEKLKLKAVPTLDGPFCDVSKFKETEMPQKMLGLYPLACEVAENDDFFDRKSNYNLLYADYLTNDAMDYKMIDMDTKNWTNIENVTPPANNNITEVYTHRTRYGGKSKINQINIPEKDVAKEIVVEVPLLTDQQNNAIVTKQEFPPQVEAPPLLEFSKKKSKVRIISEKKITEPEKKISVPVSAASFEVVKPSMILSINKNKSKNIANNTHVPQPIQVKEDQTILNDVEKSVNNVVDEIIMSFNNEKEEEIVQKNMPTSCKRDEMNLPKILNTSEPSKFDLKINLNEPNPLEKPKSPQKRECHKLHSNKNILSPERVAAINEKRKFNMKLKDIIAEELSRLEEQASTDKDILVSKKTLNNYTARSERVRTSLSKDPSLPNEHAYIVHYLEARMEKMENLLLNKIDQNTKKIMDLKRTIETKEDDKPLPAKSSTKSDLSDEAHKKQLYKEISKYLTPNCNSLLYEELFINKYDPNEGKVASAPAKRKRNR
ncbi:muscle M-line assembly protein unc-89-like [Cydia fagiglandana]|uniref:muscle M-line assembly protein unc-89-like n=1 Tax=Cydia fagiglandana TaxID=1458189 RepID=UPI002FEE2258